VDARNIRRNGGFLMFGINIIADDMQARYVSRGKMGYRER